MRDWMSDLWPASYKDFHFYVERGTAHGGRRIVVHQFPGRDDPFNEDLGEDKREFEIEAYLVGPVVDSDGDALAATCVSVDPGLLVLPEQGPIMVRCLNFERVHELDKLGRAGFRLTCIREGASTPQVPTDYLAQLAYDAAGAIGDAVAALVGQVSL